MDGIKGFFILTLAAVGGYAVISWWQRNPRSYGPSNPVASEVAGVAKSNFSSSGQMTSGVPSYNPAPIANGHGDQVSAALHTNRYATIPGGANYTPAFGPTTNQ